MKSDGTVADLLRWASVRGQCSEFFLLCGGCDWFQSVPGACTMQRVTRVPIKDLVVCRHDGMTGVSTVTPDSLMEAVKPDDELWVHLVPGRQGVVCLTRCVDPPSDDGNCTAKCVADAILISAAGTLTGRQVRGPAWPICNKSPDKRPRWLWNASGNRSWRRFGGARSGF